MLRHFGKGLFVQPHGLSIDEDGNLWVTDAQAKDGKGLQVFELSPDGRILLTLGKKGVAGDGPDTFRAASAAVVAPNGDIFVADTKTAIANRELLNSSRTGKFITEFGKKGQGQGELNLPHALAIDSRGRPVRARVWP